MNERIRELAKRVEALVESMPAEERWDWLNLYDQKFAELIVKEMCGMMEQCADDCSAGDPSEVSWEYISLLQYWIDTFKCHFGIE